MKYLDDLRTFPGEAARAWRHDGLSGVWEALASRTVHRVIRVWWGSLVEVELERIPSVEPPAGVVIRPLADGDWPGLATLLDRRMLRHFERARSLGRRCVVAWRGERPIGYFWWSEGRDPELDQRGIDAPPDVVYVWFLYVARAERRRRLGLALLNAELPEGRGVRGLRTAWMAIAAGNERALAVARRFTPEGEARIVGRLWTLKLLRWSRVGHDVRVVGRNLVRESAPVPVGASSTMAAR